VTSRPLALRFLSGRFQGGVVPLEPGRPLVLGRQPDADVVLAEDLVSRHHARIDHDAEGLFIEDLGSTNGTYVNGARVKRARLAEGDRVIVGASIVRVVARDAAAPAQTADEVATGLQRAADTVAMRRSSVMQGRVDEIPIADLLQLFATSKKTGLLVVQGDDHAAEVQLERGRVTGCTLDGRLDLPPAKGFYRLLGWSTGRFELHPTAGGAPSSPTFSEPLELLLMEGMRQIDELRRLASSLPARVAPGAPAPDLGPEDQTIVALARAGGAVAAVLDAAPFTDLEAAQRVAALLQRGALVRG
jgi:FHA domain-containing protein/uncharacterized protein DUF4388